MFRCLDGLEFQAVHPGHLQIGQQAAAPLGRVGFQKVLGGGKHRGTQPFERNQETQGVANCGVVIHLRIQSHRSCRLPLLILHARF